MDHQQVKAQPENFHYKGFLISHPPPPTDKELALQYAELKKQYHKIQVILIHGIVLQSGYTKAHCKGGT